MAITWREAEPETTDRKLAELAALFLAAARKKKQATGA